MAHAGVKNAYRATIHTWRWAWHLKPRVVRRLSAALSTSVTTNSLKLIMNDPFWEFVQLHSAEYGARTHTRAESGGSCYVSNQHFSALLFQRRRRGKLSGASLNGKLCSSLEAHDEQVTGLKHSVVVIVTWEKSLTEILKPQRSQTKHFVV